MKYLKNIILGLLVLLFTQGCKKDRDEIYKENKESVVLLQTKYVFKLKEGDKEYYFTDPSELLFGTEYLSENLDDVKKEALVSYGTGFFVSEDGKIVTNRHVIDPMAKEDKEEISSLLEKMGLNAISSLEEEREKLQKQINNDNTELSQYSSYYENNYYEKQEILNRIKNNQKEKDRINLLISEKRKKASEKLTFEIHLISVGYALNDTHVNGPDDYIDLAFLKKSDKPEVDLALLQTKDHTLPSRVEQIPKIADTDDDDYIKENEDVFMIGYNYGENLAKTSQGIQVQINSGNISQKPLDHKVMYSIPSLEGSSGSPVFNSYGKVVAVNFAGIKNNQGFNYGILARDLNEFLK